MHARDGCDSSTRFVADAKSFPLEIERAHGRWPLACARSRTDGAAPLIGSSRAMRLVRDRKVAIWMIPHSVAVDDPKLRVEVVSLAASASEKLVSRGPEKGGKGFENLGPEGKRFLKNLTPEGGKF